jgi:hypothetical protein
MTRSAARTDPKKRQSFMAELFKPGAKVKKSGIYAVVHDDNHADAHEVTCVSGKVFPSCGECGEDVRFRLVKHAVLIGRHEQFKS